MIIYPVLPAQSGVTMEQVDQALQEAVPQKVSQLENDSGFLTQHQDISGKLDKTGTAAAASKLATSRTIRTNLASTSAASFNGEANVTPGVTGVLPVANGGTGSSTEKYLPLTGGTVSGVTTFSGNANGGSVTTTEGVVIQGNLRLKGSGNCGNTLRFGDGDYVHLAEPTDDCLEIKAKKVDFITTQSPGVTVNGNPLGGGGGLTLVRSGTITGANTEQFGVDANGLYLVAMIDHRYGAGGSAFVPFSMMSVDYAVNLYQDFYYNESRAKVSIDVYFDCKKVNSTTMELAVRANKKDLGTDAIDYWVYKIG